MYPPVVNFAPPTAKQFLIQNAEAAEKHALDCVGAADIHRGRIAEFEAQEAAYRSAAAGYRAAAEMLP